MYQVVVKDANSCATAAESVTLNAPPVARAKNVTVASEANCMADTSVDDGSYDPDSGDTITVTQSPAGPYPLGNTTVTLTVTDSHGASCSATATVTVVDQTAPTLTLKPAITSLPPNHSYQTVTMSQMVASVGDCATSLSLNDVVIEKVTSDEPDDAPGTSDGSTTNDIVIAGDCKSVQLRAERDDTRNGRVYVITLRVRDAAGNTTRQDFKVNVPVGRNDTAVQDSTAQTKTSSCQ